MKEVAFTQWGDRSTQGTITVAKSRLRSMTSGQNVLTPDYINYRKPETVDKTIGDGALMWFYLSCNSYDWPCWAILKIGKKIGRLTMTTP